MTNFRKSSYWYRKSIIKHKNISKGGRLNFSYPVYIEVKSMLNNRKYFSAIRPLEASSK